MRPTDVSRAGPSGTPLLGPAPPAWRSRPVLVFAAMMLFLLGMGIYALRAPIVRPNGLPDDPDVLAARDALQGTLPIASHGLHLVSALAGDSPFVADDSLPLDRLAAAHAHLAAASRRMRGDPRLTTAMAHVQLAARRWAQAERGYRAALERVPHYGEARVGLGIVLASQTGWAGPNALDDAARGQVLAAIAQFANVDRLDPAFEAALYDRAVLLGVVGRGPDARALLEAELRDHPAGQWAERYRGLMETR